MKSTLHTAAVALVAAMAASPALAQGSIEGDVYLVMQSGDVRKMAASRVHLISQEAARRVAPLCEARDSATADYLQALRGRRVARDSARTRGPGRLEWQARANSAAAVAERAISSRRSEAEGIIQVLQAQPAAPTGMAAHYNFRNLAPGTYALFSDTNLAYFWFVEVNLGAGQHARDLDNNNVTEVATEKTLSIADAACAFAKSAAMPERTDPASHEAREHPRLLNSDEVRRDLSRHAGRFRGQLSVAMVVAEDGTVDPNTVEVVGAVGFPDQEVIEDAVGLIAERMRFSPGTVNGRPVRVWIVVPLSVN